MEAIPSFAHLKKRVAVQCRNRLTGPARAHVHHDPVTGETLISVVGEPGPEDAYVYFRFGEGTIIPYRCQYFLRFSSKLVSRDPKVTDYLREVLLRCQEILPQQPRVLVGRGLVVLLSRERDCSTRPDGCLRSAEEAEKSMSQG